MYFPLAVAVSEFYSSFRFPSRCIEKVEVMYSLIFKIEFKIFVFKFKVEIFFKFFPEKTKPNQNPKPTKSIQPNPNSHQKNLNFTCENYSTPPSNPSQLEITIHRIIGYQNNHPLHNPPNFLHFAQENYSTTISSSSVVMMNFLLKIALKTS
jgi:hypothetical protein